MEVQPPAKPAQARPKRSIIYIDGFNLYSGALTGWPLQVAESWSNPIHLLRPGDCIQKVRYFTAGLVGSHAASQDVYLSALATLPLVDIILGRFKAKRIQCLVPSCSLPSPRFFSSFEEKRTDVNIALWMLRELPGGLVRAARPD